MTEESLDRKPLIRPVDIFPIEHEGEQMVCLRDPLGVAEGPILFTLNPVVLLFLQLFDGEHSIQDIQLLLTRQTGGEVFPSDLIVQFAGELEKNGYLEGPAFEERLEKQRAAYLALEERPCALVHEDDEKALQELGSQWRRDREHPLGPGDTDLAIPKESVVGILAPHIDYIRGGYAYSWSYRTLVSSTAAKTFVILGTIHHPMAVPFCASRKPFRTPFGLMKTDTDFLDALQKRCGDFDLFGDEFAHSNEHSIELQVLYLQGMLGDRADGCRIVPILVNSFEEDVMEQRSPIERPEVRAFVNALKETIEESPTPVCLIGGVDFAHVGPRFGWESPLTDEDMSLVARQDRAMLETVEAVDPEAFIQSFFGDRNSRSVCSIAPIYCILHVMNGATKGKSLRYGQAVDPDRNGAVTFGSVVFTRVPEEKESPSPKK